MQASREFILAKVFTIRIATHLYSRKICTMLCTTNDSYIRNNRVKATSSDIGSRKEKGENGKKEKGMCKLNDFCIR